MRRKIKTAAGWVHATLFTAMLMPLLYAMEADRSEETESGLYVKCLIIVLPVILTEFAIKRCKGVGQYLLSCAGILALTGGGAFLIAAESGGMQPYAAGIVAESVVIMFARYSGRVKKQKMRETAVTENLYEEPDVRFLEKPSFPVLAFFVIVYLIGRNYGDPRICNEALLSAVIYVFAVVLYQYIDKTEEYLFANRGVCNLPTKRVYGIGRGMLALFLLFLAVAVLPSVLTTGLRTYRDIRNSHFERAVTYEEWEEEYRERETAQTQALPDPVSGQREAPVWVDWIVYAGFAAAGVLAAAVVIKNILGSFHAFRNARDENGDIVDELEKTEPLQERSPQNGAGLEREDSERERIRREYRRVIRAQKREPPRGYETPLEIEQNAGIAESAGGKELHVRYERARYGKG